MHTSNDGASLKISAIAAPQDKADGARSRWCPLKAHRLPGRGAEAGAGDFERVGCGSKDSERRAQQREENGT